jgi:hypothetical protein
VRSELHTQEIGPGTFVSRNIEITSDVVEMHHAEITIDHEFYCPKWLYFAIFLYRCTGIVRIKEMCERILYLLKRINTDVFP